MSAEEQFPEGQHPDLADLGLDVKEHKPKKGPGTPMDAVPAVESNLGVDLDSPEVQQWKNDYYEVPVDVRFRMEERTEQEAYEALKSAEAKEAQAKLIATERELGRLWEMIDRSPVDWTPEDIEKAHANALSKEPTAEDYQAAEDREAGEASTEVHEEMVNEEEASFDSSHDRKTLELIQGHRTDLLRAFERNSTPEAAQLQYEALLRGEGREPRPTGVDAVTDYFTKKSIAQKVFSWAWKRSPGGRIARIGTIGAAAFFIPGAAVAMGAGYLACEGIKFGYERVRQANENRSERKKVQRVIDRARISNERHR